MTADFRHEPWDLPLVRPRPAPNTREPDWLFRRVRSAAPEVREELEGRSFVFVEAEEFLQRRITLRNAEQAIACLPSLESAIKSAVSAVILLYAEEGYDVSHSEPRWPADIFVSVPLGDDQVSALRTAENVVHEAMHLQLTELEGQRMLVADEGRELASPWRTEPRLVRGVLHGAYVFHCVWAFFNSKPLRARLAETGITYADRRLREIATEFAEIDWRGLNESLSAEGQSLLAQVATGRAVRRS